MPDTQSPPHAVAQQCGLDWLLQPHSGWLLTPCFALVNTSMWTTVNMQHMPSHLLRCAAPPRMWPAVRRQAHAHHMAAGHLRCDQRRNGRHHCWVPCPRQAHHQHALVTSSMLMGLLHRLGGDADSRHACCCCLNGGGGRAVRLRQAAVQHVLHCRWWTRACRAWMGTVVCTWPAVLGYPACQACSDHTTGVSHVAIHIHT